MIVYNIVLFLMNIFAIAHCRNMHNIAPLGATALDALISSSAVVQEGSPKGLSAIILEGPCKLVCSSQWILVEDFFQSVE